MHESMTQDGLPCTSSAPHGKRTRAQLRQLASVGGTTCKRRSRPERATFEKDKDFCSNLDLRFFLVRRVLLRVDDVSAHGASAACYWAVDDRASGRNFPQHAHTRRCPKSQAKWRNTHVSPAARARTVFGVRRHG